VSNWKTILSSDSILIPRRLEERDQDRLQSIYKLLQKTHIEGTLDLRNTPITNLGNLTSVGECLWLENTKITNLGNLQSVGGHLSLRNTKITNLGKLQYVGGSLWLISTPISRLPEIERNKILSKVRIEGRVYF